MMPFYVVSVLWLLTGIAWQAREHAHAKERLEMLKLYRANTLTDYTAQATPAKAGRPNFIQSSIKHAYAEMLGDDDD